MSGIRYYLAVSAITLLATGCLRKEKSKAAPANALL